MDILAYVSVVIILMLAYLKGSLAKDSLSISFLMGICIYVFGGINALLGLYIFFISSSLLTKIGSKKGKKEARSSSQVLASGLIYLLMLVLGHYYQGHFYLLAFISLAVSNSDTWASEIGKLSREKVYSLIPFKKINKGLSGGVTFLGTFAAFLGSLLIAVFYYLTTRDIMSSVMILTAGFVGSFVDSILGSLVQELYYDENKDRYYEAKPSKDAHLIKGIKGINNEMVNLLSNIIVVLVYSLILM